MSNAAEYLQNKKNERNNERIAWCITGLSATPILMALFYWAVVTFLR